MSKNRGNFEQAWKSALEGKEFNPPSSVWDNVQENLQVKKERKLFALPRMMAAASVVILLAAGIYFINYYPSTNHVAEDSKTTQSERKVEQNENIALNEREERVNQNSTNTTTSKESLEITKRQEDLVAENNQTTRSSSPESDVNSPNKRNSSISIQNEEGINEVDEDGNSQLNDPEAHSLLVTDLGITYESSNDEMVDHSGVGMEADIQKSNTQIAYLDKKDPHAPEWQPELVDIYSIPLGYDLIDKDKKDKDKMIFLAGLNYSTGVFSPNGGSLTSSDAAAPAQSVSSLNSFSLSGDVTNDQVRTVVSDYTLDRKNNYQQSVAMSYGANFGVQLTERFVLFSGLNYTTTSSNLQTGVQVKETQNVLSEGFYGVSESKETVINEYEYNTNNEFEFASVPVKVGYALINKDFDLVVLTGVSTEFLLNVRRRSNEVNNGYSYFNAAIEPTEEIFNPVFFNGLVGLNAGYLLGDHYFIYVEPTYRRAINSFFKNDDSEGMSNYKMLTFGLSYRF